MRKRAPYPTFLVTISLVFAGTSVSADYYCSDDFAFSPSSDEMVYGVPDIHQVHEDLPGGGGAYCGPTAAADWTKYLALNGYPELMEEGWDDVDLVGELGSSAYMGTSPTGGTSPEGMRDGWQQYLDDTYPGAFHVTYRGLQSEDDCIPYDKIDDFIMIRLASGAYPVVRVGYYNEATAERRGGHYMAVVGYSVVPGGAVSLEVNDPSRYIDSTDSYPLQHRELGGEIRVKLVGRTKTIDGVVHHNYLDGAAVASPRLVLAVAEDTMLRARRVWKWERVIDVPVAESIVDAVFLPDSETILATTSRSSTIIRLDLFSGQSSVFATAAGGVSSPGSLVGDNRGSVWVATQGSRQHSVVELSRDGRFLQGIPHSVLATANDLAYDPIRDRVYAIDGGNGRIATIHGTPSCVYSIKPLSGVARLAVLPDGRLVYASDASPAIHVLTPSGSRCVASDVTFTLAAISSPAAILTDSAGQIYVSDATRGTHVFDERGNLRRSLDDSREGSGCALAFTEPFPATNFARYGNDDVLETCELSEDRDQNGIPDGCEGRRDLIFIRGDANASGAVDLSDSIFTLAYLFLGDTRPACAEAADTNDDGTLDISDATYALSFLFLGGPALPVPFPRCGGDPSADALSCEAFPPCSR